MKDKTLSEEEVERVIERCQAILRITMWVIPLALLLIIISTTISTGDFVRVFAKGLYYLALLSIVVSLLTWAYRSKTEKRLRMPRVV
jgi:predicted membrane protein